MILASALPIGVHAAGLGELKVLSSLGQPLRAEIELTSVSKQEKGTLIARLASKDAFKKADIGWSPVLSSLRFSVEQRQGKHFIRITSAQAINEPFIDFLMELSGGGGSTRFVREYTFLLDLPEMRKPRAAQTARPAPAADVPAPSAPAPVAKSDNPPAPSIAAKPAPADAPAASAPPAPAPPDLAEKTAPTANAEKNPDVASFDIEELIRSRSSEEQDDLVDAPIADIEKNAPTNDAKKDAEPEQPKPTAPPAPTAIAAKTPAGGGKAAAAKAKAKEDGESYRVKEGDTLSGIAIRNKDGTVSLDQMLIALYHANPDAFIGDNINRLRAGHVLSVPDISTASEVDQGEARTMVLAQARDFDAYRHKLAERVAAEPSRKTDDADKGQRDSGKVTARVEEQSPAGSARDRLQLSKAGTGNRGTAAKAAEEEKIAAERAIAEANERVKVLEKNVRDLQELLEIKNKALAEISGQTAAKPETPAPAPSAPQAAPAAAKPAATVVPAPSAKRDFLGYIRDYPFVLPGAGLLAALLTAWGMVRVRRHRKKAAAAFSTDADWGVVRVGRPRKKTTTSFSADADQEGEQTSNETDGRMVGKKPELKQPAQTARLEPSPLPAEVPEPRTEVQAKAAPEPVPEAAAAATAPDLIAEAEIHITNGHDQQAEDILRLALTTEPEHHAIRLKLLEIYARHQNVERFNGVARDLHGATGGVGAEWEQAVLMGRALDPANSLYAAGDGATDAPPPASATAATAPTPAPEEPGLEFDLSDFKGAEVQAGAAVSIDSKVDVDLDLDSGKAGGDDMPAAATSVLNGIDLDLPELAETLTQEAPRQNVLEDDESAFAAEMSTRLELATAYQEIGDKEGARELLEEVIRGGSDSQVERAREMLLRLS